MADLNRNIYLWLNIGTPSHDSLLFFLHQHLFQSIIVAEQFILFSNALVISGYARFDGMSETDKFYQEITWLT